MITLTSGKRYRSSITSPVHRSTSTRKQSPHVDDLAVVPDEAHFKIPPTPDENLREIRRIVEGLAVAVAKLDERVEDIHKRVESLRDRTRTWDGQPLWIHIRKIEAMLTEHTKPGLFG